MAVCEPSARGRVLIAAPTKADPDALFGVRTSPGAGSTLLPEAAARAGHERTAPLRAPGTVTIHERSFRGALSATEPHASSAVENLRAGYGETATFAQVSTNRASRTIS